ncbi:MAG: RidA/YER057c/UK114 superfamily protein, partial [uncultured Solirubrobacteraceae bacterium]
ARTSPRPHRPRGPARRRALLARRRARLGALLLRADAAGSCHGQVGRGRRGRADRTVPREPPDRLRGRRRAARGRGALRGLRHGHDHLRGGQRGLCDVLLVRAAGAHDHRRRRAAARRGGRDRRDRRAAGV